MNTRRVLFAALCLALCIAFGAACSQENMSKVTLYFGINGQARLMPEKTIFDRLREFFYGTVYAKCGPTWVGTHDSITLTVTGDGMDTITAAVPPSTASYTIELPMGNSRVFTMIAYLGTVKKWGGHVLANTNESEMDLPLNMFPIVTNFTVSLAWDTSTEVQWDYFTGALSGYRLYRSANPSGPYELIATIPSTANNYWSGTTPTVPNGIHYYRMSVVYTQGEGEPCDAVSALVTTP